MFFLLYSFFLVYSNLLQVYFFLHFYVVIHEVKIDILLIFLMLIFRQMAMQAAFPAAALPGAQIVANAFVEQYYHILHQSPDLVYKFYQDSSVLSRPNSDGVMTSVTAMQVSPL